MAMDSRVVYGLLDPRTGMIVYVGVTKNPSYRYLEHLRMPRKEGNQKNAWIKELIDLGLKPVFVFLDSVNESQHEEAEQKWIAHFQKLGALYNHRLKIKK